MTNHSNDETLTNGAGLNNGSNLDTGAGFDSYSLAGELGLTAGEVTEMQALRYRPLGLSSLARPGGSPMVSYQDGEQTLLYQIPAGPGQVDDVRWLLDRGDLK